MVYELTKIKDSRLIANCFRSIVYLNEYLKVSINNKIT